MFWIPTVCLNLACDNFLSLLHRGGCWGSKQSNAILGLMEIVSLSPMWSLPDGLTLAVQWPKRLKVSAGTPCWKRFLQSRWDIFCGRSLQRGPEGQPFRLDLTGQRRLLDGSHRPMIITTPIRVYVNKTRALNKLLHKFNQNQINLFPLKRLLYPKPPGRARWKSYVDLSSLVII